MSEATRRRVFEPFFTTKPSGQGTGLGLALAAETVGRHRGRIVVTSAPGGGSCFEVFIPTATGLAPTEPTSGATGKASAGGGYRILIVDDDADVREVLAALFGAPHQVTTACDGKAALTLLERDRRFDAILCDVMMPEMDGVAVLEAIQARWPELVPRLVYITAGALGARARALVAAGGILVLEKPFGRREALAMVAQAAGRSGGDGAGPARESS
jgi:CheY-like chemotaxis protein